MSDQPMMPRAAMRGAVDLSGLGQTPSAPPAGGGAGAGAAGVRMDATEANFQDAVMSTREVAALVVLWSAAHPETEQAVTNAVTIASQQDGRLRVIAVEVQANPQIAAAFQAQQIPMTLGLIGGQPVPLFAGVQPADQLAPVVAELLKVASQNGVTGRIPDAGAPEQEPAEPPVDPRFEAAFQAQQIPMTLGLIGGQPVPLFAGVQPADQLAPVVAELLKVASQNGVTGRIPDAGGSEQEPAEPPVDPRFEAAFDAVEAGDYDTAIGAYEQVLKESPADEEAKAGLAQVKLLKRVSAADMGQAREAAAANPNDVDAQLLAADFDLVGGHVEDAFSRLVDLVRRTADDERNAVRTHLLELFEIVGPKDERVVKARRALMSALF